MPAPSAPIQAAGLVADADLTRAGVADGHVDQLQDFGAAGGGDLDGAGHGVVSSKAGTGYAMRRRFAARRHASP
jgi:hypothetical protein